MTTSKKKTSSKKKPVQPKTEVALWVEAMNKNRQYKGHAQIRLASEVNTVYDLRRPTGILSLDIALGGGIHAGGATELYGAESSGKTTLLWRIFAQNQQIHGEDSKLLLLSTELRPDRGQARLAGCCIAYSDQEILQLDVARKKAGHKTFTSDDVEDLKKQIGDIVIVTTGTADHGLDVVVDALRFGKFQIAAIDSLGNLLTPAVEEGSTGDAHYAGPARIVTQFQNKVAPMYAIDREDGSMLETSLIGINQVRAKIGASKFEDPDKGAMGAWAWKHGLLVSLKLTKGAKLKVNNETVGHRVNWITRKGKAGTHDGKVGSYEYYHIPKLAPVFWRDVCAYNYGGVGEFEDYVQVGVSNGLITKTGSYYECADFNIRTQGIKSFAEKVANNDDLAKYIKEESLRKSQLL